jgi:hypothetical protein
MTGFTIESEKLARFEEKIFKLLFKYMRKEKKNEKSPIED